MSKGRERDEEGLDVDGEDDEDTTPDREDGPTKIGRAVETHPTQGDGWSLNGSKVSVGLVAIGALSI
jgi:hypothetical protein